MNLIGKNCRMQMHDQLSDGEICRRTGQGGVLGDGVMRSQMLVKVYFCLNFK